MVNVLIVGSNGFLGKELSKQCLQRGWSVTKIVRDKSKVKDDSVFEIQDVNGIPFDYIFNVAAFIPYLHYNSSNSKLVDSNIKLPIYLNEHFPSSKIIYASSVSVYGDNQDLITEESSFHKPTLYGLSKLAGETITMQQEKFSIVRFSSLYGTGMYSKTFLPFTISSALTNKKITLYGLGTRKQNYLHVSDAAEYLIAAALCPKNGIFLGTDVESYSNYDIAKTISTFLSDTEIIFDGIDNSPSFLYHNESTRNQLNFSPKISISEGIKSLINEK